MKTTLTILLTASFTCNAFLVFLIHQRSIGPPSAAPGVAQSEYDRVSDLYQKDEERIASIKQRLPIFCVIIQAALLEEKYRSGMILDKYFASIDTSKCPMDFQQAGSPMSRKKGKTKGNNPQPRPSFLLVWEPEC